jgi:aspartyl-tRNA(Asn)/glutamyl-tRNA(Gln) amidotransferase subunit C
VTVSSGGGAADGAPPGRSPLDADAVRRIAALAGLALTDAEVARYAAQFEGILAHFASLASVATGGIPPLAHPLGLTDVLRDDAVREGLSRDAALAGAPDTDGATFRVPRVAPEREP